MDPGSEGAGADDVLERVRTIVMRYGWNSVAYQILNPGFEHWFSGAGDAVVGYIPRGNYRVVGGAPVCPPDRLQAVTEEFENDAAQAGLRVVYFGAGRRMYEDSRTAPAHASIALGAQPVWNPRHWVEAVRTQSNVRAQLNRARNKGVVVSEWAPGRANDSPELRACLQDWLNSRPMPPMHFLVEPNTLEYLEDRRLFAAERNGRVIAYLVASPVPTRNGWLIEQIVRGSGHVNGCSELLLDHAVGVFAGEGAQYVTLGMSPLSRRAAVAVSAARKNPSWLRVLLAAVRKFGQRFYHFDGLDRFKAKFHPQHWEPLFALSNERSFSPGAIYAIAAAFSDKSPASQLGRALRKAAGKVA